MKHIKINTQTTVYTNLQKNIAEVQMVVSISFNRFLEKLYDLHFLFDIHVHVSFVVQNPLAKYSKYPFLYLYLFTMNI